MNIESIRSYCLSLPSVTEDIKWGNDLCFCIAGKMFCVTPLAEPMSISFKVKDDEFDELINRIGVSPAPYTARYKWVLVTDIDVFSTLEIESYINQSYELVKSKLSKKKQKELGLL